MGALRGYLRRTAVARGVLGGNRLWLVVAIVIYGRRIMRRLLGDAPEVVYSEELQPGQSLLITHERSAAIMEG